MSKLFCNALKLNPVILGATLLLANGTQGAEMRLVELAPNSAAAATSLPTTSLEPLVSSAQLLAQNATSVSTKSAPEEIAAQQQVADNRSESATSQFSQNTPAPDALGEAAPTAFAQETTVSQLSMPASDMLAQVTSVSQLSDVQPTDWAFQALQLLVERYGVIAGYPDGTYRGNRALTRYEFAAGLNAALDRVNQLIAAGFEERVRREDLATLQRLQEEFAAELATLRGRIDTLEAHTASLTANQFSTTTKLVGEVIFAVADVFGENLEDNEGDNLDVNTILADRVRLNFDTSFTGKDFLRTRLEAINITQFDDDVTGTDMTRLGFDGDGDNDVTIDDLYYRFPLGDRFRVVLALNSVEFEDIVDVVSPVASSSEGAISRFGRFNPVLRIPDDSSGLSLDFILSDALTVSAGYLVDTGIASDPSDEAGLFEGQYAAFANVVFNASDTFKLGVSYVRSYAPGGEVDFAGTTGSAIAQDPLGVATSSDSVAAQASLGLGRRLTLSGWLGYTWANAQADGVAVEQGDEAHILNWAAVLALPDLGREGNLAAVIFGQPPRVVDSDLDKDDDTSYHLEGFYRLRLTDNISITPGVFVIFNPEHDNDNDTLYVGTIRTTITF